MYKKIFQRLQTKRGTSRHSWQHAVHGSKKKNRRARRPDSKAQVRIPRARRPSANPQERNARAMRKGRLSKFSKLSNETCI